MSGRTTGERVRESGDRLRARPACRKGPAHAGEVVS